MFRFRFHDGRCKRLKTIFYFYWNYLIFIKLKYIKSHHGQGIHGKRIVLKNPYLPYSNLLCPPCSIYMPKLIYHVCISNIYKVNLIKNIFLKLLRTKVKEVILIIQRYIYGQNIAETQKSSNYTTCIQYTHT